MFIEENTYHGQWWLPESPDKKAHGELQVTKSGQCLLNIFLTDDFPWTDDSLALKFFGTHRDVGEYFDHPKLIGRLYSGEFVTLEQLRCVLSREIISINQPIKYQFSCRPSFTCMSFVNFETDEIKVDELYIDIDGLKYFIGKSGIKHSPNQENNEYNISYKPQPTFELFTNEEMTAKAFLKSQIPLIDFEASIKETASIILTYKNPRSIKEWKEDIISLNYFICTLYGQPLPLTSIRAHMEGEQPDKKLNFIFYSEPHQQIKKVPRGALLFEYSDDEKNTGKILYEFIKLIRKYSLIFESFFLSQFTDGQYKAVRFFMIVTALEGFHRQLRCNHNSSQKRLGLEKRLNDLFEEFDKISDQQHEWGELASDTTKYRNQEAHILKLDPDITGMTSMISAMGTLQAVFAVLFLNEAAKRCDFTIPLDWINGRNWLTGRLPKSKNTPEDAS